MEDCALTYSAIEPEQMRGIFLADSSLPACTSSAGSSLCLIYTSPLLSRAAAGTLRDTIPSFVTMQANKLWMG